MNDAIVVLPVQSCIAQADEIHQLLDEMLLSGQPVVLDASKVDRVDTSVLQMLCSFVNTARSKGLSLRWSGASVNFTTSATLLGLQSILMPA